ncbi:MAG TPA: hypothetical protein VJW75_08685 [Candidatus Eisenbacteria bacterium]|nr:hypothetical protein [Candidatus Eisenbacteria bacterium]
MHHRFAWVLLAVGTFGPLGCDHKVVAPAPAPPTIVHVVPTPIDLFIANEEVPKPQAWHGFVPLDGGEVMFFRLRYGDIHYDLAGDFYSEAWGLKYGSRVGWVFHEDMFHNPDDLAMFDITADDTYLFSEDTWDALQAGSLHPSDRWLFEAGFMPMLVRDADTPEAVLITALERYPYDSVAYPMLQNPAVQRSRVMLTLILNIPGNGSATWAYIHSRAYELLLALP